MREAFAMPVQLPVMVMSPVVVPCVTVLTGLMAILFIAGDTPCGSWHAVQLPFIFVPMPVTDMKLWELPKWPPWNLPSLYAKLPRHVSFVDQRVVLQLLHTFVLPTLS